MGIEGGEGGDGVLVFEFYGGGIVVLDFVGQEFDRGGFICT